jgi:hypothetical protein
VNGWFLAAGALAAATTAVHATAGGRSIVRPLLAGSLPDEPRRTLHVVWHLVTADLLLSSAALLFLAWTHAPSTALALFIGAQYLAYTAVFLAVTLTAGWPRPLLQLPQWTLLLPVSLCTFAGAA